MTKLIDAKRKDQVTLAHERAMPPEKSDMASELTESGELSDLMEMDEPVELRQLSIPPNLHGQRLDRALVELVPEFSRNYLRQLVEADAVILNGKSQNKPAQKVRAGDTGSIELRPTPQTQAFQPENIFVDVVYEDPHVLVINKPAGLVVHPAPGHWRGTLLNALLGRDSGAMNLPRAGIVHRLDKDTSGLMVVARSRAAMDALVVQIAARQVNRQYLALAHRAWMGEPQRSVDAGIGRDPKNRLRMAVIDLSRAPGKTARTDFTLLGNAENEKQQEHDGCFVRCTLHTGRTHQIRVHMASIGHALLADITYGGSPSAGMMRQALHAERLAFAHPITGESMHFEAPLPDDMQRALQIWGLDPSLAANQ